MVVILIGVTGAGKTTIGLKLAGEIGWPFYDADDFHPLESIGGLTRSEAPSERDRGVRLDELRTLIAGILAGREHAVVACSALKESYRRLLAVDPDHVRFVYLKGAEALIRVRLRNRSGHFVTNEQLTAQLQALEEPAPGGALIVEIDDRPGRIIEKLRASLRI